MRMLLLLIVFMGSLLLGCTPGENFKQGEKVYDVADIYVLVDTVSFAETKANYKDDIAELKIARNNHKSRHPYMWQSFKIDPKQFYERSTSLVGTVVGYSGKYSGRKNSQKLLYEYYEIEIDKDIKLIEDRDLFGDPNRDDDPLTDKKDFNYKVVPKRCFIRGSSPASKSDNPIYK
jgi:hypothetical protein